MKERNARFAKVTRHVHAEFAADLDQLRAARAAAERRALDLARSVGALRRAANERAIRAQLAEERERGALRRVLVALATTGHECDALLREILDTTAAAEPSDLKGARGGSAGAAGVGGGGESTAAGRRRVAVSISSLSAARIANRLAQGPRINTSLVIV